MKADGPATNSGTRPEGSRPEGSRPLRVLVADDDPLIRQAIRAMLSRAGIVLVAEASNGRDALRMARHYQPDVILLDVVMPSMDGITTLERMQADENIHARIVMLSGRGDHDVALLALRKGALGYLTKDADLAALPRVLHDVAGGTAALSRSLTTHLVERLRELPEGGVRMRPIQSVLTPREWQVADMLSLGNNTDEIAEILVLTVDTVRTHIKNIMRKLDVHSRSDLIESVERLRSGLHDGQAHDRPTLSQTAV